MPLLPMLARWKRAYQVFWISSYKPNLSYPNRNIFLSRTEQDRICKLLSAVKPNNEFLTSVASVTSVPTPVVDLATKQIGGWLGQPHPFELGAVACTLAYQQAVATAIGHHWTSAIG